MMSCQCPPETRVRCSLTISWDSGLSLEPGGGFLKENVMSVDTSLDENCYVSQSMIRTK